MNQATVVLEHGATLGEEIKTLRTLFDKGYYYDRTEHCHDIDLIILNNYDTNRQEQMQQDIDRLHNIITDLTSEKDAYEEMLQHTQQELEEQKQINKNLDRHLQNNKDMLNSQYGALYKVHPVIMPDPPRQDCVSNETISTDQPTQQTQPDQTRPDKTVEGVEIIPFYDLSYVASGDYYEISEVGYDDLFIGRKVYIGFVCQDTILLRRKGSYLELVCKVIERDPLQLKSLIKVK